MLDSAKFILFRFQEMVFAVLFFNTYLLFLMLLLPIGSGKSAKNLVIGAIFCNEDHIMVEWLNHYYSEGVDHFVMVDNCPSMRNAEVLRPYVDAGLVTLYTNQSKHMQNELYNAYVLPWIMKKKPPNWLMILDLDEFLYAPHHADIVSALKLPVMNLCDSIQVPWLHYGSSGLAVNSKSVVQGNIMRVDYNKHMQTNSKSIVRAKRVTKLLTHRHILREVKTENRILCSRILTTHSKLNLPNRSHATHLDGRLSPEIIPNLVFRINHYPLQSRDYFFEVKARRGDAGTARKDGMRNQSYFEKYDRNEYFDDELAQRRKRHTVDALTGKLL